MAIDGTPVMKSCSVCGSGELSPTEAGGDGKPALRCNRCGNSEPENMPEDHSAAARNDIDPSTIASSELRNHRQLLEEMKSDIQALGRSNMRHQERLETALQNLERVHGKDGSKPPAREPAEQTSPEIEARDNHMNLAQMVKNMVEAEARFQLAMDQVKSLLLERDALFDSTTYRAALAIRRIALRYPNISRVLAKTLRGGRRLVGSRARSTGAAQAAKASHDSAGPAFQLPIEKTVDVEEWPKDRPLVSVVIPCFNYGHFVREAIETALAQTFTDIEIIVIEGGSSSLESRRQLAELNYSKTRVLLQGKPHRVGANRNYGIKNARGKYICCLDADDKLDPTYIEKAVFLLEHHQFDVVSSRLKFFGNRQDEWGGIERPTLADLLKANHVLTCAVFRYSLWGKGGRVSRLRRTGGSHSRRLGFLDTPRRGGSPLPEHNWRSASRIPQSWRELKQD